MYMQLVQPRWRPIIPQRRAVSVGPAMVDVCLTQPIDHTIGGRAAARSAATKCRAGTNGEQTLPAAAAAVGAPDAAGTAPGVDGATGAAGAAGPPIPGDGNIIGGGPELDGAPPLIGACIPGA